MLVTTSEDSDSTPQSSSSSESTKVKCELCPIVLASKDERLAHCVSAHGGYVYKCNLPNCEKTFKTGTGLSYHVRNAHNLTFEYKCQKCSRSFSNKRQRDAHVNSHKKKMYQCKFCDYEAARKFDVTTRHLGTCKENPDNKFKCGPCNEIYASFEEVYKHKINYHRAKGRHMCAYCHILFGTAKGLEVHNCAGLEKVDPVKLLRQTRSGMRC